MAEQSALLPPMRLTVATLTNQRYELQAHPGDSIASIKAQIFREVGAPPEQQRIMLAGEDLANERTLAECGVADGAILHMVLKLEDPPAPEVAAAMARHGLTSAEQQQLHSEGVRGIDTLAALRDADFELSGIDIRARRQERLQQDRAAARARHSEALAQQAQSVLDEVALSAAGRQTVTGITTLDAIRGLTAERMAALGMGMADRKVLSNFIAADRVQNMPPVAMEEVVTEPERRRADLALQQASVRERREAQWRQAAQAASQPQPGRVDPGPASSLEDIAARHGLPRCAPEPPEPDGRSRSSAPAPLRTLLGGVARAAAENAYTSGRAAWLTWMQRSSSSSCSSYSDSASVGPLSDSLGRVCQSDRPFCQSDRLPFADRSGAAFGRSGTLNSFREDARSRPRLGRLRGGNTRARRRGRERRPAAR